MKNNRLLFLLLLIPICWLGYYLFSQHTPSHSDSDDAERIRRVENNLYGAVLVEGEGPWSIEERMTLYGISGLSIAAVRDYKIDWAKGYGWSDQSERRKVSTQTLFQAASISKSLNGVGLLKLVQDKKVELEADINNYLTSWKFPYDKSSSNRKVTIAQLLSHTAGLSVHGFRGYANGEQIPTILQILDGKPPANNQPIRSLFEPDMKVQYSGGGTTISQLIVMDVTGLAYDEYMSKHVLKPMGMRRSFYGTKVPVLNLYVQTRPLL